MIKYAFSILLSFMLLLLNFSCSGHQIQKYLKNEIDVILFSPVQFGGPRDIKSYGEISAELDLTTKEVSHEFINQRASFFDKDGRRKFKVLIIPGGEPYRWFEQTMGHGLNCEGVKNILDFVESGGSVIAICVCGSSLFVTYYERLGPLLEEAQRGEWHKTYRLSGYFRRFCGMNAFKGVVRGPQETNRPYPKTRFLPIKMNPENEIVREAKVPSTIYMIVSGGGSLLPDEGQPLDVVGWYPNGTVAIGVVPYGRGRIVLSNPHPNITGKEAEGMQRGSGWEGRARRWGWTNEMIKEDRIRTKDDSDPDGLEPDWALAKSMLSYAYKKASQ
jgi:glutamine amidotransferase-like uncharacterized protein